MDMARQGRVVPGPRPSGLRTAAETVEFFLLSPWLGGWRRFFERRRARHGDVFRVHLFEPAVALLDRRTMAVLFDAADLHQDHGFGWARPPLALTGGAVPAVFLNGDEHRRWKALWLDLLRDAAPELRPRFDRATAEFFGRWRTMGAFGWRDELEGFAAALLFEWLLGARPDLAAVRLVYRNIFDHLAPGLARRFPRSLYARSLRAYPALAAFAQAAPRFPRLAELAARRGLVDERALAHQLLFLLGMNAYLGTQNLLKSVAGELGSRPEVRRALADELLAARADGAPDLRALDALPVLEATVAETLRLHSPVSFIFGRATEDRLLPSPAGPFAVRAGELLMGVLPFAQLDARDFAEPGRFDLHRYRGTDAASRLVWPRGRPDRPATADDRTCPGKDAARTIAKLFAAELTEWDWRWEEPVRWSDRRFGLNAAAPAGAMPVSGFRPRAAA